MASTFFFSYNNGRKEKEERERMDMALLEVRHLKKNIYKPVRDQSGAGIKRCILYDRRRRIHCGDGGIRIWKDDAVKSAGLL